MMPDVTWEDLGQAALARQFPAADAGSVADLVARLGPIQSQNARAPFIGLAARHPGLTHAEISAAYEAFEIVRGSNLRGTVHTATAADHGLLDAATRLGQSTIAARTLNLVDTTLEQVWRGIEDFASGQWRPPAELFEHLLEWLRRHDPQAPHRLDDPSGRYFAFSHGGLIRRPLGTAAWSGQGAAGYRTAVAVLSPDLSPARRDLLENPEATAEAIVLRHVSCYGPASRWDIAWWSGLGLRPIDAALMRLAPELTGVTGPDARTYWHLRDQTPSPADIPESALLPEFDALLCAYDPPARRRFVDPAHYDILWKKQNGQLLAPLLTHGRLTGFWRLAGSGPRRTLLVTYFKGTPKPTKTSLEGPTAALVAALSVQVTDVQVQQHG